MISSFLSPPPHIYARHHPILSMLSRKLQFIVLVLTIFISHKRAIKGAPELISLASLSSLSFNITKANLLKNEADFIAFLPQSLLTVLLLAV